MWAYGGFPCGQYPDLSIARKKFVKLLKEGERAIADKGYRDFRYFCNPSGTGYVSKYMKKVLARHENVNRRIKSFECLSGTFRHNVFLHHDFFHAVANIVQLSIECGEKLPDVAA